MCSKFILVLSLLGSLAATAYANPVSVTAADLAADDLVSAVTNSPVKNPQQPSASINPPGISDASGQDDKSPSLATAYNLFNLPFEELMQLKVTSVSLFARNALTVASTVKVIKRDDWERNGSRRMLDAVGNQPGTMLLPTVFGQNIIAIRGYARTGSATGIATRLDGIPMNEPRRGSGQLATQNIELGVLDSIELVRGPGSALYGSDAFHGVVVMSAFESEQDVSRMSAEGGVNDFYQAALQHSKGFGNGTRVNLAIAASGEQLERSYQVRDPLTGLPQKVKPDESTASRTATLKMSFKPSSSLKLTAGLYFDDYDTFNSPCCPGVVADSDWNSRTQAGQFIATQQLGGDSTLQARVYYVNTREDRFAASVSVGSGIGDSEVSTDLSRSGAELIYRQPEIEGFNTQLAFGLGYESANFKNGYIVLTPYPLDGTTAPQVLDFPGQGNERDITYLLLDARTVLSDERWSVNYGGRLDEYSNEGTVLTPRLGFIFQPSENSAFKLLYNKAFRAPSIGERYSVADLDLAPETLDSYEFVFLTAGRNWTSELVLFENHWNDAITFALDASQASGFTYKNTGANKAHGLEASFTWQTDGPWRFDFSGSYIKSRNLITEQDYELFPRTMATMGIRRRFDSLDTDMTITNHIFAQAKDTSVQTSTDLPLYWRTDLVFSKSISKKLDIHINVINLFGRDNRWPSVLGFAEGVADRPFSVSIGLRYSM
jgi:outer membrane cobalamin receptor